MTDINDLVLVHFEDRPLLFGRIEDIQPDVKPGWYHVTLLMLQIPPQQVTWILRETYINGTEFTMNGKRMRLERVESPAPSRPDADPPLEEAPEKPNADKPKVISFADLKKVDRPS
jgi:hypothetical protein